MTLTKKILDLAEANLVTPMKNPFGGTNALDKLLGKLSSSDLEKYQNIAKKQLHRDKDRDWLFSNIRSRLYYTLVILLLDKKISINEMTDYDKYSVLLSEYSNYFIPSTTVSNRYKNYKVLLEESEPVENTPATESNIQTYGKLIRDRSENRWYTPLESGPPFTYVSPSRLGTYGDFLTEPWGGYPALGKEELQNYYRINAPNIVASAQMLLKDVPVITSEVKQSLAQDFTNLVASHVTLKNSIKVGILDAAGIPLRKRANSAESINSGVDSISSSNLRYGSVFEDEQSPNYLKEMPLEIWTFIKNKLAEIETTNRQKNIVLQDVEEGLYSALRHSAESVDKKNKKTVVLSIIKFQTKYTRFKEALAGSGDPKFYSNAECIDIKDINSYYTRKKEDYQHEPSSVILKKLYLGKVIIKKRPGYALSLTFIGSEASPEIKEASWSGIVGLITEDMHNQIVTGASKIASGSDYFNRLIEEFRTTGTASWHGDYLKVLENIIKTSYDVNTRLFKEEGVIFSDGPEGMRHPDIKNIKVMLNGSSVNEYSATSQEEYREFIQNSPSLKALNDEIIKTEAFLENSRFTKAQYLRFISYVKSPLDKKLTLFTEKDFLADAMRACAEFSSAHTTKTLGDLYEEIRAEVIKPYIESSTDLTKLNNSISAIEQSLRNGMFLLDSSEGDVGPWPGAYVFGIIFNFKKGDSPFFSLIKANRSSFKDYSGRLKGEKSLENDGRPREQDISDLLVDFGEEEDEIIP